VAFSPNGRFLVSASPESVFISPLKGNGKSVFLYGTHFQTTGFNPKNPRTSVSFSGNGERLFYSVNNVLTIFKRVD
jgi:WD40 repeat protein